jgi:pimeloyl-ACP methyl ester carboxylesterase
LSAPWAHAVTAPGIVFLPGLGAPGYLRHWVGRTRAWASTEVLDLPGWRGGRATGCEPTIDAIAEATIRRLSDRAGERLVLIGHSTGAQAAALVAQRAPHRLAGVVLAGPTFDPSMRGWVGLLGRTLRTLPHEATGELPAVIPKYVRSGVLPAFTLLRDGVRQGAAVYGPVQLPVLVLAGKHDYLAPPSWADRLAQHLGAEKAIVPGGHNFCFTHSAAADQATRARVESWFAAAT